MNSKIGFSPAASGRSYSRYKPPGGEEQRSIGKGLNGSTYCVLQRENESKTFSDVVTIHIAYWQEEDIKQQNQEASSIPRKSKIEIARMVLF